MSATLTQAKLSCPVCREKFSSEAAATGQPVACPSCRRDVESVLFPALTRPTATSAIAGPMIENGAACFYHPQNAAHVPCDNCGRFLCSLCDLPLGGRHLCPACVESTARKPAENPWSSTRFLWGRAALLISIGPVLAYPLTFLTFLTAPAAALLAILWWKKPAGVTGGGRAPLVLALIFAVAQIIAWIGLIFVFVGIVEKKAAIRSAAELLFQ